MSLWEYLSLLTICITINSMWSTYWLRQYQHTVKSHTNVFSIDEYKETAK